MHSQSRLPSDRAARIVLSLLLVGALACLFAGTAKAGYYRMVLCAANNGSNGFNTATNTSSSQNPGGIFSFENYCGPAPLPAGSNAFLRIAENQAAGSAGENAYGSISWTAPPWIEIAGAGGYTREPNAFNDGWRGRFWLEGLNGTTNNVLMQGSGVDNGSCGGVCWAPTPVFASHLWPFGGFGRYRRFAFELTCLRQAGCDRTNFNAVDANTMILTLDDVDPSRIGLTQTDSGFLGGAWVRGTQNVTYNVFDQGSGMRFERMRVDGGERAVLDWRSSCNIDSNGAVGEFSRDFKPCPEGATSRSLQLDTASLPDGAHTVQVCSQDYAQSVGLNGTGGESCDQRAVRVDNNPPAAPGGLAILTANPERYLDHFGAAWTLPPDPGSPIAKVHYDIVNAAGSVVVPEQVLSGANPTKIDQIAAPGVPGNYRLRAWLEDEVGFTGPAATVPIPRDTTPPASPQELSVTSPTSSRTERGFDARWRNITDNGAPIDALHYQVLSPSGETVVSKSLPGANPEALADLEAPPSSGNYTLKLWLSDAEGNMGTPAEAPLSYDCVRSDVAGGESLSAGIGERSAPALKLHQGEGTSIGGVLRGSNGPLAGAPVCVFGRIVTDAEAEFLGIALTGADGGYSFPLAAGPSREVIARHRNGHREIEAKATVLTQILPTLRLRKKVVRNKRKAVFYGEIPGPHNDDVVVVLQVKSGKGWRAFRRFRTRGGGRFEVAYRFTQTHRPSTYTMRAQVRRTVGLPYEPGDSREVKLRVKP